LFVEVELNEQINDQSHGWPSDPRPLRWRIAEVLASNLLVLAAFAVVAAITYAVIR